MMWWIGTLLLLGLLALERLLYRESFQRAREAQRTWKDASRALSAAERREVGRAVRHGCAVGDRRLAPAAVALATAMVDSPLWTPLRRVNFALALAWFTRPVIIAATRRRWVVATALFIALLCILAVVALALRYRRNADEALLANRRLADRSPP